MRDNKKRPLKKKKVDFRAIDIVYETSFKKDTRVICYFSQNIQLVYRSYVGKFDKGQEKVINRAVRQFSLLSKLFCKKS